MRIFVKKSMGRTFGLDVDAQDTVWVVKTKLQEHHGIPTANQMLCFTGPPLVNSHVLKDLGVKDKSVLCLLDRRFYQIIVCIDRCSHLLLVEASDIAEDLKKRIEKKVGVPEQQQLLFFNTHVLMETQPLFQLGLRPGSIVHVFRVCPAREWARALPA